VSNWAAWHSGGFEYLVQVPLQDVELGPVRPVFGEGHELPCLGEAMRLGRGREGGDDCLRLGGHPMRIAPRTNRRYQSRLEQEFDNQTTG